jgi:hypothetical protein
MCHHINSRNRRRFWVGMALAGIAILITTRWIDSEHNKNFSKPGHRLEERKP